MAERIPKKTTRDVIQILENADKIEILGENRYGIPSQTVDGKMYTVVVGETAQTCDCPRSRKGTHTCKHIYAARILYSLNEIAATRIGDEEDAEATDGPQKRTDLPETIPDRCTECLSTHFRKWGKRGTDRKGKVQTYKCYDCKKRFTGDAPSHRLAVNTRIFALVVSTYFDGLSYKETSEHMAREGIRISPSTVRNYVMRAVDACLEIFQKLHPEVSDMWSIDDQRVKVKKNVRKYFYCIMDHRGRLMLALREFKTKGASDLRILFQDAKELAGCIPVALLSDADAAIIKAARQSLVEKRKGIVKSTYHNPGAHIRGERTNNRQERLERTLGRWSRRFGFVCAADNNRTRGMMIHYNFCRKHTAIGCTPAEEAGLFVGGNNPWQTLYAHAIWDRIKRGIKAARKSGATKKPRRKKSAEKCDKLTRWMTGMVVTCTS